MELRKCRTSPKKMGYKQIPTFIVPLRQKIRRRNMPQIQKFDDEEKDYRNFRIKRNLIEEEPQNYLQKKQNMPSIKLISFFCLFIVVILYFLFSSGSSCMEKYQKFQCWKDQKIGSEDCLNLQNCIASQDDNYFQFLLTFLGGCLLLFKKYQREVLLFICKIQDNQEKTKKIRNSK